jgi:hypothetical protein
MLGSQILEVAIGLVFVYTLLSLLCSQIMELVARTLAMRAQTLEDGIRNMLRDPSGVGLAGELYRHPLITGLSPKNEGWALLGRGGKPSYLSSRQFVLALFDLVAPAQGERSKDFSEVRTAVANIQNAEARQALLTLIDAAGDNLEQARKNVESWFTEAMNRVSGWYKRKAQIIILGLALGFSAGLNADSLLLANTLWRDSTLRAAVVAAAEQSAQTPLPPDTDGTFTRIGELQVELQRLDLPLGWSTQAGDPRQVPADLRSWMAKIAGLLLTALALSLGAPFWFGVLNKLVQLRSTGRPEGPTGDAPRS